MNLSPELSTLLLAALPLTELRASIPLGVSVFHLSSWSAFWFSIIGNAIPVPIIFFGLKPVVGFLEKRIPWLHQHLTYYFEKKRLRFKDSYDKYGAVALAIFVAIPLPMTGAWTGAVLAVLFKIKPLYSIPAIIIGEIIAGLIVTMIVCGTLGFLNWML